MRLLFFKKVASKKGILHEAYFKKTRSYKRIIYCVRDSFIQKRTVMNRNKFLITLSMSVPALWSLSHRFQDRKDPLPHKQVLEFVRAGHNDLAAVEQMLQEVPALLNATWDWGNGDFETALGGASHMGNPEIAEFLISKGARPDIFTFAMLGRADAVRAMTEAYPAMLRSSGPHGISLYTHALKGGDRAVAVRDYLESKGITE